MCYDRVAINIDNRYSAAGAIRRGGVRKVVRRRDCAAEGKIVKGGRKRGSARSVARSARCFFSLFSSRTRKRRKLTVAVLLRIKNLVVERALSVSPSDREWRICDLLCKSNYVTPVLPSRYPSPFWRLFHQFLSTSLFPSLSLFCLPIFLASPARAASNGWLLHFRAPRTENRSYIQTKRPRLPLEVLYSRRG